MLHRLAWAISSPVCPQNKRLPDKTPTSVPWLLQHLPATSQSTFPKSHSLISPPPCSGLTGASPAGTSTHNSAPGRATASSSPLQQALLMGNGRGDGIALPTSSLHHFKLLLYKPGISDLAFVFTLTFTGPGHFLTQFVSIA